MVIAIDGPAGAGKSTVARGVADALGMALAVLHAGLDPDDATVVTALAAGLTIGFAGAGVELDGRDVSSAIREPEVRAIASRVSVHPGVREAMVARQRALIAAAPYVAEGRDIGTVVSPNAPLKVFLTADDAERARRRAAESGQPVEDVVAALAERDARDREREHGALRRAADAIELDTTGLAVDDVVRHVVALATARGLP
jgi:cytidylate kinase